MFNKLCWLFQLFLKLIIVVFVTTTTTKACCWLYLIAANFLIPVLKKSKWIVKAKDLLIFLSLKQFYVFCGKFFYRHTCKLDKIRAGI